MEAAAATMFWRRGTVARWCSAPPHQTTPAQRRVERRARGKAEAANHRRRRVETAATEVHASPQNDDEGGQQRPRKTNRRKTAREEGSARRWAPSAAARVAGASWGSPSSAQGGRVASSRERVWVKRNRARVVGPIDRLTGSVGFNPTRSPDQRAPGPIYKY